MSTKKEKANAADGAKNESKSAIGDAWIEQPLVVRRFIEQRAGYEQMCNEVAYILNQRLKQEEIKTALITSRAKTLESFLEKIGRKSYKDPFTDLTDFAGARVVCYYPDDLPKIEKIIGDNFFVAEHISKAKEKASDQFGYLADHYLVRLNESMAGARYDDLKSLICEIQVRTVLQDAWAVFSHHILYKREDEIPDALKRHIYSLAGALESADLSFQTIRDKRDEYLESLKVADKPADIESMEINLDSLDAYMKLLIPNKPVSYNERGIELSKLQTVLSRKWFLKKYPTLGSLRQLLRRTKAARDVIYTSNPKIVRSSNSELFFAMLLDAPDDEPIISDGYYKDLRDSAINLVDR